MAKLSSYEQSEEKRKKTSDINFRFGEKDDLQPKGFDKLSPDCPVTIIIKGKTKSFSSGDEWDKSKRLTVSLDAVEIINNKAEKISMADALKAADATRKKVK